MLTIINFAIDYARAGMYFRSNFAGRSNPVLSWGALSSHANARQSAYRVTAGEYDSGWVESELQEARLPEGTLLPGIRTEVTVQIRDDAGNESAPYADYIYNAYIDWDAPWIGDPLAEREHALYLRKKFTVKPGLKSTRIYACGLGYQIVLFNGCNIEGARLDPAYTDFSRRVNYVFYPDDDIYPKQGENEISAIVGAGWRDNRGVHQNDWLKDASFRFEGPQQFTAMLFLEYEDGTTEVVKTGSDWEAGEGPLRECSLFNGSTYDARIDVIYHRPAAILPAPGGKMEPMLIPPMRDTAFREPIAAWPDGEDAVILDYGQNIAGVLFLHIPEKLAPGQRIEITHSEELTEDGKLFRETLRSARAEDVYIAAGDESGLEIFTPQFTYHGFRYARIAGLGADFDARPVSAVELRTDADSRSTFRCGNALVSRIHELCVATERANIHSILTDCPQRDERMGWLNDATVRFEATPYNVDVGALFPKVVRDVMDVQTEAGAIGCTAPYVGGSIPADPVCSSFLIAGWEALMHTGNLDIIREAYPAFAAWEDCLLAHSDDYIVNYSYYGDWAGPVDCCVGQPDPANPGAVSAVTPGIFMSTGYSYFNCQLLAKMAEHLCLSEEAARHRDTAERVKNALLDKWYDPITGAFATGSQACQAFPLWLGIAPDPEKSAARLHDAVEKAGCRLTTGNLCSRYIMDALAKHGYLEDAWRLLIREEYPSLGYMIGQEATTVWERFELMTNPCMNSHSHPMYAAVDYFLYAYLAGVKPAAPGWRRFTVEPHLPKHLMSAQATVDTPLGEVSVRWVRRYDGTHLTVNVPFGARAEIRFGGETREAGSGFHHFSWREA